MFGLIRACIQNAIAWILAVVFSGLIMLQLVYTYITRITSTPWQPKNRVLMETPTCLNDPKYGVHKYLTINVITLFEHLNRDHFLIVLNMFTTAFIL